MSHAGDLARLVRGCVDVTTAEGLEEKLRRDRPLVVKVGFDPTAPDIHLGHTVLMRKMRDFQACGHRVVFVIGDFTASIGDPTGRSRTRPPLSPEEIRHNAETYQQQAFKILDAEHTEIRFNSEWLSALGADGFIRLAAKYNVARMLERRDFRQRYEAGQAIAIHEFLYPLAQAYDSVALEADVELGGTDQLFNLNVGRDVMPAFGLEAQVVMTTPLLEGTDGVEKMSKSLGNYVGVNEAPDVMFAKLLSISDPLMWRYYELLTDLDADAMALEKGRAAPMASKLQLARMLVSAFHGAPAGAAAEDEWRRVHQQRQVPSELPARDVAPGRHKLHELLALLGEARSKSEAVRLVRAGAVKLDGNVVEGEIVLAEGEERVLSIGPRRHLKVRAARR